MRRHNDSPKSHTVLTSRGKKQGGAATSAERWTTTTGVFWTSPTGHLAPMLIFKRKRLNTNLGEGAPHETVLRCSDSGCMDSENFVAYMQHFINEVKPTREEPILLILDGHKSHTKNIEAIDLARNSGVIMLSLPPHTSDKMQPLDVSFFHPLKRYYNQAISTWFRNHAGRTLTAYQIDQVMNDAFMKAATMKNAVSGFAKCGIWPCNRKTFQETDFIPLGNTEQLQDACPEAGLIR